MSAAKARRASNGDPPFLPRACVFVADTPQSLPISRTFAVGTAQQSGTSAVSLNADDPGASVRKLRPLRGVSPANTHARGKFDVSVSTPAVVIAAPASGSGKTTVATGLMGALRRAGRSVAPFKVGPDFIDPGYHALAADRPGRNQDLVLVGEGQIGPLYRHGSAAADIAVIEGVMGLFDGRIADDFTGTAAGSTAQVAALLGAPVILVVDGRGQSHSVAALLHGFSTFDPAIRLAGVILNRVGSAAPRRGPAAGVRAYRDSGARGHTAGRRIVRSLKASRPRHRRRTRSAGARRSGGDDRSGGPPRRPRRGDRRSRPAGSPTIRGIPAWPTPWPVTPPSRSRRAGRSASATPTRELLRAAEPTLSSSTRCRPAAARAAALVMPGGFPEEFTTELSANDRVRQQINALAANGAPVHAECAGLTTSSTSSTGIRCAACYPDPRGSPNASPWVSRRRRGDRLVAACRWRAGRRARIPPHRSHLRRQLPPAWVYRGPEGETVRDGAVHRGVHAGYLHTHPAAHPHAVTRFVAAAATSRLAG